ncbi:MAG TPA: TIGR03546 family protein [Treponema sp.]|nr:TIGR03546 family protein [Treponema sp.]
MIKFLLKFFKSLNANAHPGDIAHAVSLGLLLALVPKGNLMWPFLFALTFFIRMNKGAFFLSLILLSFVIPFIDIPVEQFGYYMLSLDYLNPIYITLYQIPFVGLTRFNNTMVAGSFYIGILSYLPTYILIRFAILGYRKKLQPMIINSKAYKVFNRLPLIKMIRNVANLGGAK